MVGPRRPDEIPVKVVTTNRRARRNFEILETLEAGIVLVGSEVKSLRAGQVDLKDGYASIAGGEAWLYSVHIAPYGFSGPAGHDPERSRKLLLHRRQIDRLGAQIAEKGLTLVPLSVYFKDGIVKVELGLGKGRRTYDKRRAIRQREEEREMARARRRRGPR